MTFENEGVMTAASDIRDVRGRESVTAFFLGLVIIAVSIFLGRSYVFFGIFLVFSILMTMVWRQAPRPWI